MALCQQGATRKGGLLLSISERSLLLATHLQRPQLWEAHFLRFRGWRLNFHHAPPHLSLDISHFKTKQANKTKADQEAICLAGKGTKTTTPKTGRGSQENTKYGCASLTSPLLPPPPPPHPC